MLLRMKSLLMSLLLSISLVTGSNAEIPVLTEKDAGREVILKNGAEFMIQLPANPTTGYSWSVMVSPLDLLVQEKPSRYVASDHAGHLVGAGGSECWQFRFVKPGCAKLSFAYARPWEKGMPPMRVVEFSVRR